MGDLDEEDLLERRRKSLPLAPGGKFDRKGFFAAHPALPTPAPAPAAPPPTFILKRARGPIRGVGPARPAPAPPPARPARRRRAPAPPVPSFRQQRETAIAFHRLGYTPRQIAARLGTSERQVRAHLATLRDP